jgi:hypothetical protein
VSPANAGGAGFNIDAQTPGVGLGADGKAAQGYTVQFTTASGVKGELFIPRKDYQVANVQRIVAEHAATLEAVAKLGS